MRWIVFFDGDCAFCSRSVRWLAHHDRHDRIRFAPLQGEFGRSKDLSHYADKAGGTMVILREPDGASFTYSAGWMETARALGGPWRLLTVFKLVPRCIRDAVYRVFARNRYRWFGHADACGMPDEEVVRRLM